VAAGGWAAPSSDGAGWGRPSRVTDSPARNPTLELVHATPRRVRLRLPQNLLTGTSRAGIAKVLSSHGRIIHHRFNTACSSLVIDHDGTLSSKDVCRLVEAAEPASMSPLSQAPAGNASGKWVAMSVGGVLALAGSPLAAPILLASALPIFRRAFGSLVKDRKLNIDVLDSLALVLTMTGGHMVTAAAVTAMIEGGEWLRDATASRSRRALGDLIADRNAAVVKIVGTQRVTVPVAELKAGDIVSLAFGDHIPVDGVVHTGTAAVDERFLTGEPLPARRSVGDRLYAMTVVADGELQMVAGTDVEHSRAARIVNFLEQAPIGDTRMSDHVRRIGDRFVVPTLGLGAAVLAATGSTSRAASVITFDIVTGIRVSAPTTMLASLTAASRDGVLIKGAAAMESLAQIDAIVFDKTGTLTAGRPEVVKVHSFGDFDLDELLMIAASADHSIRHPLAVALCAEADARGLASAPPVERRYEIGLGVEAHLDGHHYVVGNRLLMKRWGVRPAPPAPELDQFADATKVWIARPPNCLGAVVMRDVPREEARRVIDDLRMRGVRELMLLSGDSDGPARRVAGSLGLDEWRARVTPEGKANVVRKLKKRGFRVAVVGDGINDSVAFTQADVAVAMGNGSDIASSTAQVVLMDDDLTLLPRAIDRARDAVGLMRQNLAIISLPNLFGILFALMVPMSPAVAGLLSNGSTILAAANGLRPLNGGPASASLLPM